jgi:hypothetical protein
MPEHSRSSMEQYYAEFPQDDRLKSGFGQLEFERTKTIVQRFLPLPPAVVRRGLSKERAVKSSISVSIYWRIGGVPLGIGRHLRVWR